MSFENEEAFSVNVTILEGTHYAWSNMNSYVLIKVGKQKSVTKIRRNTDSPYYNQYFVFEFETTLQEILDKVLTLSVFRPRQSVKPKKLLGYCAMDVATVWAQPNHQFYRKWAILSSPKADDEGPRGYLKVTISITAKGHVPIIPLTNPLGDDEIEGNLLLPEGITTERQKALFIFKIYKGINISTHKIKKPFVELEDEKEKKEEENKNELPNSYFRIIFAGLKGQTRVCHKTFQPIWNQSLTFSELFPPLCQRVKLQLNYNSGCGRYSKAVKYIKLHSIANDSEHGFLPTFGPTYIHFYENDKIASNYVGKVLISLETKLFSETHTRTRVVLVDKILPLLESALWSYENMVLFGVILDASVIDKRFSRKQISFEINWGAKKISETTNNLYSTIKYTPTSYERKFWKIDFQTSFPCLHRTSIYPNTKRRLYNINLIEDIITKTKNYLDEIHILLFHDEISDNSDVGKKLKDLFEYLEKACKNCREIIEPTGDILVTTLDKHKMNHCLRELQDIEVLSRTAYLDRIKKKSYKRGVKFLSRLEEILDHPQECFPDVFLWMNYGDKRVSCIQIPARKLLYSTIGDEHGCFCGKVFPQYFKTNKISSSHSKTICKVDCFLWLGIDKYISSCINSLPKGFESPEVIDSADVLPSFLQSISSTTFFCRAFIYQGRFLFAYDETGLSDFVVTIIIGNQTKSTKEMKATLNPIWDTTLVIKNIVAHGTKEHIRNNPPIVTIEVTDKDRCFQTEYVGRSYVNPAIKFNDDEKALPQLSWSKIWNDKIEVGGVLCHIELLEVTPSLENNLQNIPRGIPEDIKPALTTYRMEVLFWGIRNLKNFHQIPISKPKIIIECVGYKLSSEVITNIKNDLNFMEPIKYIDMNLPINEDFLPPLSIKLYDTRNLGHDVYVGTHLKFVQKLLFHPVSKSKWLKKMEKFETKSYDSLTSNFEESITVIDTKAPKYYQEPVKLEDKKKKKRGFKFFINLIKMLFKRKKKETFEDIYGVIEEIKEEDEDLTDWWTKYFTSLDKKSMSNRNYVAIYNTELESQAIFSNFEDTMNSFKIYRGKTIGDPHADDKSAIAVLKAKIKLYAHDKSVDYVTACGFPLEKGFFQAYPNNDGVNFVARVYCVRGIKLRPMDLSGKCDSYIVIKMGKITINDSENYVASNVNPIYGRCFELKGVFPKDHSLTLSVFDWDRHSLDDFIGKTVIDLEKRLYTKHRGHCGLQSDYKESGAFPWRDQIKPTEILEKLCKRYNLDPPRYTADSVGVGFKTMYPLTPEEIQKNNARINKEVMALYMLHHWQDLPIIGCHLVPEHVETRSLYNPKKPGLEQGKIQLWIDIFPIRDLPAPPMINIVPRKPVSYELRVIIWNTEDVILNEDDFFGDRKSDIYVKGWMDKPDNAQETDVHYRSLTGEGNFNWRFIFNFDYLTTENKMIIKTKETFYSVDETELKIPCRIKLQVWDNDIFSPDDFLGELTMELSKMPRGPNNPKKCTLHVVEPRAPTLNLFKIKRTRGWWPFRASDKTATKKTLTGKLEAEFELLTADEATLNPAGVGRSAPQPLPPPNRPKSSFSWVSNPLKTCRYIIWKNMKYKLLKLIIIGLLLLLIALGVYNFPGYSVKKIMGA